MEEKWVSIYIGLIGVMCHISICNIKGSHWGTI